MHAYLPVALAPSGSGTAGLYRDAYRERPFVRVLDAPPELTHAVGTNFALIHATQSTDGREIQVSVAIDNLIKGAGGQAIQAMNLALDIDERAGLTAAGIYPC
jgi:N-acetyl-gamma-glutamyl-phosphate reductase